MFRLFANCIVILSLLVLYGCDDVPNISLPNEPPVARDDSVSTRQNRPIIIDVLLNDSDIDGDQLAVTLITETTNGEVALLASPSTYIYSPNNYFIGSDEFTYEITDNVMGHTASATVSIEIARHETRAIFSSLSGTEEKVYMLDSRDAATFVDLTQVLEDGEVLLNWVINELLDLLVILTDANRVVTVTLDEPDTIVNSIELDTTNGFPDGGLILSTDGLRAVATLANRYLVEIDLLEGEILSETDSTFETGTMMPSFFAQIGTAIVMQGTLGADTEERSAIYYVPLNSTAPTPILDDADILQSLVVRPFSSSAALLWLLDDATMPVAPAAYDCAAPPPQTLSAVSFTLLSEPAMSTDLNDSSGLLADPTTLISYDNGDLAPSLLVAACPPDIDIVQIIQIPYLDPTTAQFIASADDISDGLWNIDIQPRGGRVIYMIDGDTGLRTLEIDLTDTDPVITDLTSSLPDYQTYTVDTELRVPPSRYSSDAQRWLFLAPVGDELTRLEWLQVETSELSTVDLPFAAINFVSDGFFTLVHGETSDTGSTPMALIELNTLDITSVDFPGELAETPSDPLHQLESAIRLYLVR